MAPYPTSDPAPQQLHNTTPIGTPNVTPYPTSVPAPQQLQYNPAIPNAGPNLNPQYLNQGSSVPYYGPFASVPQYFNYGFVPAPNYVPVVPMFPQVNTVSFGDCDDPTCPCHWQN